MLVEQCGGTVTVEQCWCNSGKVTVEKWNSVGGTVKQ